jgi:hypothetical protein
VSAIVAAEKVIADRLFAQMIALIIIFFLALLTYRFVAGRFLPK